MEKNKEKYLFKYMTFEQFVDLIELERLYLTHVTLWEDCYEGYEVEKFGEYLLKGKELNEKAQHISKQWNEIKKKLYYAQSWTKLIDESDAMWRIYSPQKTGVRIKVKKNDIAKCISQLQELQQDSYTDFCMGDVEYDKPIDYEKFRVNKDEAEESNIKAYDVSTMPLIYSKRKAFTHEEEFRFSFKLCIVKLFKEFCEEVTDKNDATEKNMNALYNYDYPKVVHYKIENSLIDEVLLDPRAPKYFEETFIQYCNNKDFEEKNIDFKKSDLYTKK